MAGCDKQALKIGFVGAGRLAQLHMANMKTLKAEVSAVWNRAEDKEMAAEAGKKFGSRVYSDIKEMLEAESLDGLYICLIPSEHGVAELLGIEKGLPLFIEKPVAIRTEVGEKILQEIKKKNIITAGGYQWRYLDLLEKTKELLKEKKAVMVYGFWLSRRPALAWWHVRALSGGQMIEQTSHIFDTCRYLFGKPTNIHALWVPSDDEQNIEKATSVNIEFDSGVIANISSANVLPVRYRGGLHIMGEEIIIELMSEKSLMQSTSMTVIAKDKTEKIYAENDSYLEEDRTFLEAVRTEDSSAIKSDYADALETLRLSEDAYRSIKERA